jgi:hypothetical protein
MLIIFHKSKSVPITFETSPVDVSKVISNWREIVEKRKENYM